MLKKWKLKMSIKMLVNNTHNSTVIKKVIKWGKEKQNSEKRKKREISTNYPSIIKWDKDKYLKENL